MDKFCLFHFHGRYAEALSLILYFAHCHTFLLYFCRRHYLLPFSFLSRRALPHPVLAVAQPKSDLKSPKLKLFLSNILIEQFAQEGEKNVLKKRAFWRAFAHPLCVFARSQQLLLVFFRTFQKICAFRRKVL